MSAELAVEKLNKFEKKNQSSFPVWNIEKQMGKHNTIQLRARTKEGCAKNYQLSGALFAVLNFTIAGLSNADIADILSISPDTVKNYQKRLSHEFGVGGRIPIIAQLIEEGVLTFEPSISESA